jgi:hypothetical protein
LAVGSSQLLAYAKTELMTNVKSLITTKKIKANYLHLLKFNNVTHLHLIKIKFPSVTKLKNTQFKALRYEK